MRTILVRNRKRAVVRTFSDFSSECCASAERGRTAGSGWLWWLFVSRSCQHVGGVIGCWWVVIDLPVGYMLAVEVEVVNYTRRTQRLVFAH